MLFISVGVLEGSSIDCYNIQIFRASKEFVQKQCCAIHHSIFSWYHIDIWSCLHCDDICPKFTKISDKCTYFSLQTRLFIRIIKSSTAISPSIAFELPGQFNLQSCAFVIFVVSFTLHCLQLLMRKLPYYPTFKPMRQFLLFKKGPDLSPWVKKK